MKLGDATVDFTALSNSDLDNVYAVAYAAGDNVTATAAALEIENREASISGFVLNLLGTPFPQFDAIQAQKGEFVGSTQAGQSVAASAGNLATEAASAAKPVLGTLALLSVAGIVLAFYFGGKR